MLISDPMPIRGSLGRNSTAPVREVLRTPSPNLVLVLIESAKYCTSCDYKFVSSSAVPVVMTAVAAVGSISMIMTMVRVPVLGVLITPFPVHLFLSTDPNTKFLGQDVKNPLVPNNLNNCTRACHVRHIL